MWKRLSSFAVLLAATTLLLGLAPAHADGWNQARTFGRPATEVNGGRATLTTTQVFLAGSDFYDRKLGLKGANGAYYYFGSRTVGAGIFPLNQYVRGGDRRGGPDFNAGAQQPAFYNTVIDRTGPTGTYRGDWGGYRRNIGPSAASGITTVSVRIYSSTPNAVVPNPNVNYGSGSPRPYEINNNLAYQSGVNFFGWGSTVAVFGTSGYRFCSSFPFAGSGNYTEWRHSQNTGC